MRSPSCSGREKIESFAPVPWDSELGWLAKPQRQRTETAGEVKMRVGGAGVPPP